MQSTPEDLKLTDPGQRRGVDRGIRQCGRSLAGGMKGGGGGWRVGPKRSDGALRGFREKRGFGAELRVNRAGRCYGQAEGRSVLEAGR